MSGVELSWCALATLGSDVAFCWSERNGKTSSGNRSPNQQRRCLPCWTANDDFAIVPLNCEFEEQCVVLQFERIRKGRTECKTGLLSSDQTKPHNGSSKGHAFDHEFEFNNEHIPSIQSGNKRGSSLFSCKAAVHTNTDMTCWSPSMAAQ